MGSRDGPRPGGIGLRIVLLANLIAMIAYGAVEPRELSKVAAECATIGVAGLAMAVQAYVAVAVYAPRWLPYAVWVVVGLDGLCSAGWVAAVAALSYWDRGVVYEPRGGDPAEWFECGAARGWDDVVTSSGIGKWIHLAWCPVEVDGRKWLVGNGAARQQLHVLIGLSVVSLLFTGLIMVWTIRRGLYLGLITPRRRRPQT